MPRWQSSMNYASFTNLPTSTNPAHSVDDGKTVSVSVGRCRLLALLVTPATEFVCIAVFGLIHSRPRRLILLYSPEPAKYLLSQKMYCNAH